MRSKSYNKNRKIYNRCLVCTTIIPLDCDVCFGCWVELEIEERDDLVGEGDCIAYITNSRLFSGKGK